MKLIILAVIATCTVTFAALASSMSQTQANVESAYIALHK